MTDAAEWSFDTCLLLGTIRAARVLMRRYDNMLKPHEITVVQFAVLMEVRRREGATINAIADHLDMDRSTLTRNLDLLVARGLVAKEAAERGNAKSCVLTAKGNALLETLIPPLLDERNKLRGRLSEADADTFLEQLGVLMKA